MKVGLRRSESRPADVTLGGTASRALSWSVLNTALSKLGTVLIGVVLARLLGAEAFGTYAVALVALTAMLSFNELGVSLAIVRWRNDPGEIAPTVTTISVATSLILAIGSFLAAPAFAAAMGDSSATPVIQLMTACIVISGVVATPAALMQREFMQRRRMLIDQINIWIGAFVSLTLAFAGMGAMSLAVGRVAATVISAVLFVALSPRKIRFGLDRSKFGPLMRFGLPLAGTSIIVFMVGFADQLVVGAFFGPTALGFYVLAFNLASWPVTMFSQPLRSVAPAAFARIQHRSTAMGRTLVLVVGLLAAVTLPVCFLLAGAATPIVELVYGQQWLPSAEILVWLALMACFRIFFELAYDYLVVLKRSRELFLIQVAWLILLVPGLLLGAKLWGVDGVAAIQVVIAAIFILPLYLVRLRADGLPLRQLGRRTALPIAGSILVGVGAAALSAWTNSPFLAVLVAGLFCVAVIAALIFLYRSQLRELRQTSAE